MSLATGEQILRRYSSSLGRVPTSPRSNPHTAAYQPPIPDCRPRDHRSSSEKLAAPSACAASLVLLSCACLCGCWSRGESQFVYLQWLDFLRYINSSLDVAIEVRDQERELSAL